jgi:DNA-binding XRE family transcriptional regulator
MLALPQRVPLALPSSNVQAPLTGESLRAWRKSQGPKGITQLAAAQALGVSRESIIRAEKKADESLSGSLLCALLTKGSR